MKPYQKILFCVTDTNLSNYCETFFALNSS